MKKHIFWLAINFLFYQYELIAQNNPISKFNNVFAFKLWTVLKKNNTNTFVSPLSIHTVLTLLSQGTKDNTQKELFELLETDEATINKYYSPFLDSIISHKETSTFNTANSFWRKKEISWNQMYFDKMQEKFKAESYDFDNSNIDSVNNQAKIWVQKQTQGMIASLPQSFTTESFFTISNTAYFNANWSQEFNENQTQNKRFYLLNKKHILTPMMNLKFYANYTETPHAQVIQIPYSLNKYSLVIFLPKKRNGLEKLEAHLDANSFEQSINNMKTSYINLSLPKLKAATNLNLKPILIKFGLENVLSPSNPDFQNIGNIPQNNKSEIFHNTVLELNEYGTKAAAVTEYTMITGGLFKKRRLPRIKDFKVDHPFLFFIIDNNTHSILFMGKQLTPLE